MSQQDTVYKSSDVTAYDFGDPTAPPDFDPNGRGYKDPPPGRHLCVIEDYQLVPNKEFKVKDTPCFTTQLRPQLVVVGSEQPAAIGASIMDFLPMPARGAALPALLANRWANFIKSLGFDLPPGQTVPAEMQAAAVAGRNPVELIRGRRCYVTIVNKVDRDTKKPILQDNGLPRMEVKFFGYEPETAGHPGGNGAPAAGQGATHAPTPAAPAAQKTFEL